MADQVLVCAVCRREFLARPAFADHLYWPETRGGRLTPPMCPGEVDRSGAAAFEARRADAALIAAAPELRDALAWALGHLDYESIPDVPAERNRMAEVRALLARIDGGAHAFQEKTDYPSPEGMEKPCRVCFRSRAAHDAATPSPVNQAGTRQEEKG